ncbi:MAG TPA: hypothetical protein VMS17_08380, partial [Gemmataceae bacterium]|nr:hypothetical protein [Gemmataceae bacterium]
MQQKWYALRTFLLKVPGLGLVCRFLVHRWTRSVAAWTVALVSVAVASWLMYSCYDQPDRPERTQGYTFIDFAGQWIMGRMLAR